MILHHVGCLAQDLDESISYYRELHPKISEPVEIAQQGVRVCFVDTGTGVAIELVQATSEASVVHRLLRRGIVFYHLGYLVSNYDERVADLAEKNYKVVQEFRSEAFNGARCAFLTSPLAHLIELIESPPA